MARLFKPTRSALMVSALSFNAESTLDSAMVKLRVPLIRVLLGAGLMSLPTIGLAQTTPTPPTPATTPNAATQALSLPGLGTGTASGDAPQPTLLEADTIERGESDDIVIATGNVTSRAQGRIIRADRMIYNQRTGIINAQGNVVVLNADGSSTFAEQLTLDDELATGVAANFAARLASGAVLASAAAVRRENVGNLLSNVIYTACQICKDGKTKPTWVVRARRANQDEQNQTINYNDVVFEVKGVPVLYVPYFQHPDPSVGRKSGFLQPTPGQTSRYGYFWEQPYLLVIDQSSDLTITPLISQFVNPLLQGVSAVVFSGMLDIEGSVTRERFFNKRGEKLGIEDWRSHLFARAKFDINETWNWGFGAETASDDLYLFRYRIASDGQPRGLIRPQTSRLMSEVFVQGQGENWYVRSLAASFQDLIGTPGDPNGRRKNVPKVAPLIDVNYRLNWGPLNGRLDLIGSGVALNRTDDRLDSLRASVGATWRGSAILPVGIVVEPSALVRTDYFNYSAQSRGISGLLATPLKADAFARTVGLVSVQASWPLQRLGNRFNASLEPQINLTFASDATAQDRIRVEDTLGFELDSTAIMRSAGAAGFDQWEAGGRISVGIKAGVDLVDTGGAAQSPVRATAFLGRRYRVDDDKNFSRASNLDRQNSDWVSEIEVNYRDVMQVAARLRYDDEAAKLVRTEIEARLKVWRTETSVRYQNFELIAAGVGRQNEEIVGITRFRVNKNFRLFTSLVRNITDQANINLSYGVIYGDECTDFRLFYEELGTRNRFLEPSRALRFQIAFRTLGTLSDAPFD
ncbi:MAG: LPS-assembly protein LptD [Hyphomonadaceae bacterium]|nr:LPS-assembly protein LptD [Hyphomonadaceae bacterium]